MPSGRTRCDFPREEPRRRKRASAEGEHEAQPPSPLPPFGNHEEWPSAGDGAPQKQNEKAVLPFWGEAAFAASGRSADLSIREKPPRVHSPEGKMHGKIAGDHELHSGESPFRRMAGESGESRRAAGRRIKGHFKKAQGINEDILSILVVITRIYDKIFGNKGSNLESPVTAAGLRHICAECRHT